MHSGYYHHLYEAEQNNPACTSSISTQGAMLVSRVSEHLLDLYGHLPSESLTESLFIHDKSYRPSIREKLMQNRRQASHSALRKDMFFDGAVKTMLWWRQKLQSMPFVKKVPRNRNHACVVHLQNFKRWICGIDWDAWDGSSCGTSWQEQSSHRLWPLNVSVNRPFKFEFRRCYIC